MAHFLFPWAALSHLLELASVAEKAREFRAWYTSDPAPVPKHKCVHPAFGCQGCRVCCVDHRCKVHFKAHASGKGCDHSKHCKGQVASRCAFGACSNHCRDNHHCLYHMCKRTEKLARNAKRKTTKIKKKKT